VERRDPLLGLGGLTTLLGLLVFGWIARERPDNVECARPGAARTLEAWTVGLAPAAFVTACGCVYVALWASAGQRGSERPRTASVVLAAVVLAIGLEWWIDGSESPVGSWALVTLFGLLATPLVAPALMLGVWWFRRKRRYVWAWRSLRVLCWWSLLILIPAFVVLVSLWGYDFNCQSE
jgi:hypothetical protein